MVDWVVPKRSRAERKAEVGREPNTYTRSAMTIEVHILTMYGAVGDASNAIRTPGG